MRGVHLINAHNTVGVETEQIIGDERGPRSNTDDVFGIGPAPVKKTLLNEFKRNRRQLKRYFAQSLHSGVF